MGWRPSPLLQSRSPMAANKRSKDLRSTVTSTCPLHNGQNVCEEMADSNLPSSYNLKFYTPKVSRMEPEVMMVSVKKFGEVHLLFQWLIFMVNHVKLQRCMCFLFRFQSSTWTKKSQVGLSTQNVKRSLDIQYFQARIGRDFLWNTHNGWCNIEKANSLFNYTIWKGSMASHSHVLVYHGPILSHLLGVAPSAFTTA